MNYLAHAYLSNQQSHLLVGNFIADHIRGNKFEDLPANIIEGIHMHRKIDSFTDAHPEFKKAKRVFYDGFEKHSGILVDIYFDHLLAKNFKNYSSTPLIDFSNSVYSVYVKNSNFLPEGSNRFLSYVIKNNIYHAYASEEGIKTVLYHLSNRIQHNVQLDTSFLLFQKHEESLNDSFGTFFEDACKTFLRD